MGITGMDSSTTQSRENLEDIRDRAVARLHVRFRDLEKGWTDWLERPERASLERVHALAADLTTASGVHGMPDVSAMARALEIRLRGALTAPERPSPGEVHSLTSLLASLRYTVRHRRASAPHLRRAVSRMPEPTTLRRSEDIFLMEGTLECAPSEWRLSMVLSDFGYCVRSFDSLDALRRGLEESAPSALILDCPCLNDSVEKVRALLAEISEESRPPVLIISGGDDLESRLKAYRAGATAYFAKPVSPSSIVDKLDHLLTDPQSEPYRVLIVDDDVTLSQVYELVLQERGWITRVVNDPMQVMIPLADFSPDVILMDVYMPGVSGVELAGVIRQKEEYVSVPIVFLSIEEDIDTQVRAMSQGADDFLSKSMRPDLLAASLESRVRRYRTLRSMLIKDSLTGLLNHTNIKLRLENELTRAQRLGTLMAFAMIDLDHFKLVNDTYGHPAGDQVLKTLATVLRQRLRKSDLIGRYGGEEFAVILLDLDTPEDAAAILDDIRGSFARINHESPSGEFRVTLSCGVALYPDFTTASEISDAADRALYEAKRSGRDRLVMASPE